MLSCVTRLTSFIASTLPFTASRTVSCATPRSRAASAAPDSSSFLLISSWVCSVIAPVVSSRLARKSRCACSCSCSACLASICLSMRKPSTVVAPMIASPHGPPSIPIMPLTPDLKPDKAPLVTPLTAPPNVCTPPLAVTATRDMPDSSRAEARVSRPSTIIGPEALRKADAIFPPKPSALLAYPTQFFSELVDLSRASVQPLLRAVRVSRPAASTGVGIDVIAEANPCNNGSDTSTPSDSTPKAAVA